ALPGTGHGSAMPIWCAAGRRAVRTEAQTSQHLSHHHDKESLAYINMPYTIKGLSCFFCACGDGPAMQHPSPVVRGSRDLQKEPHRMHHAIGHTSPPHVSRQAGVSHRSAIGSLAAYAAR